MTNDEFKTWRKSFGLTQEEAAKALDMARRQIQKYENGDAEIPLTVALACSALSAGLGPYPHVPTFDI